MSSGIFPAPCLCYSQASKISSRRSPSSATPGTEYVSEVAFNLAATVRIGRIPASYTFGLQNILGPVVHSFALSLAFIVRYTETQK